MIILGLRVTSTIWTLDSSNSLSRFLPWSMAHLMNHSGKIRDLIMSVTKVEPETEVTVFRVAGEGVGAEERSPPKKLKVKVEAMMTAKTVPRMKRTLEAISSNLSSLTFFNSSLGHTFLRPILSLAEQVVLQISHLGISTTSEFSIFLVIQSSMQSSCTQAIDPEHSHSVMRGLVSSQQILHFCSSIQGLSKMILCDILALISKALSIQC